MALTERKLNELFHLNPSEDIYLQDVLLTSRLYKYTEKNGQWQWGEATSEKGAYNFDYLRCFYSIPYMQASYIAGQKPETELPAAGVRFKVTDSDTYLIAGTFLDIDERLYDDVPLVPFEAAKAAFEKEIMAGRLRSVDVVRLCYVPCHVSKQRDSWRLIPAWYISGGYTKDEKREFIPNYYNGRQVDDGVERSEMVFLANPGGLLKKRTDIQIIPWEGIK